MMKLQEFNIRMMGSLFAIFSGPLLLILLCSSGELAAIGYSEGRNETVGILVHDNFGWIDTHKNYSAEVNGETTTRGPVRPITTHNAEKLEDPDPSKRRKRHADDFHLSGHNFGGNGASRGDSSFEGTPFFDVHLDQAIVEPDVKDALSAHPPGFNADMTQRFHFDDFVLGGFVEDDAMMTIGSPLLKRMDSHGSIMIRRRRSGRLPHLLPHQLHNHHTQQNQQNQPWQRQLSPHHQQQRQFPPQQFQQQTDERLFNAPSFTSEEHEQQILFAQQQQQQQQRPQLRQDGGQFLFTAFHPQSQQQPSSQQLHPHRLQQKFQPHPPFQPPQQQFQSQQQQSPPQMPFQQPFQPRQLQPQPSFHQQQPNRQPPQHTVQSPPSQRSSPVRPQQTPVITASPRFTLPTSPTPPTKSMIPFPHDLNPVQNPLLPPTAVAEQEQLEREIAGKELDFISSGAGHSRAEFGEKDNKESNEMPDDTSELDEEEEGKTPEKPLEQKKPLEKKPEFAERINKF